MVLAGGQRAQRLYRLRSVAVPDQQTKALFTVISRFSVLLSSPDAPTDVSFFHVVLPLPFEGRAGGRRLRQISVESNFSHSEVQKLHDLHAIDED